MIFYSLLSNFSVLPNSFIRAFFHVIGVTNESSLFVTTCGCPADHVGGFKNGGLKKMLSECRSWLVITCCVSLL